MVLNERYNLESNLDVSVFICPQLTPGIPIQLGVGCGPRTHILKMFLWKFQGITLVKAHNFNIFQRCVSRMQTQTSSFFLPSLLPSI